MPRPKRTPLQLFRRRERARQAADRQALLEYRQLLHRQHRAKRDIITLTRRMKVEQFRVLLHWQDQWWAKHPEYKRYRERR